LSIAAIRDPSGYRKIGGRIYCFIGERDNFADIAGARERWSLSATVSVIRLMISVAVLA